MIKKFLLCLALLLSVGTTPALAAPNESSTDCQRPVTTAEKTVCDSDDLSKLDRRVTNMAHGVEWFLAESGSKTDPQSAVSSFVQSQIEWRKSRDACGEDVKCLEHNMRSRFYHLINRRNTDDKKPIDQFIGEYVYKDGLGSLAIMRVSPALLLFSLAASKADESDMFVRMGGFVKINGKTVELYLHRDDTKACAVLTAMSAAHYFLLSDNQQAGCGKKELYTGKYKWMFK